MLRRIVSHLVLGVLTHFLCMIFLISIANANLGTDSEGLYAYSDTLHSEDPDSPIHTFSTILDTGTAISLSDETVNGPIEIGFEFVFYDVAYTQVWISSNGWVSFQSNTSARSSSSAIPDVASPNAYIALMWEDIHPGNGGEVLYQTRGVEGRRSFLVEFNNVPHYSNSDPMTVQLELIEGHDEILIHIDDDSDETGTHTIGIENEDGTTGIEYYRGSMAAIDLSGHTIRFFPLRDAPRLSIVTTDPVVPEGGSLELEVAAVDRQGGDISIEWDIDLDGDYSDAEGTTATISAANIDGPGTVSFGIRATDEDGNADNRFYEIPVVNVQPIFVDFPERLDVVLGEEFSFSPTVEDPGQDDFFVTIENAPEGVIILAGGGLRWEPQLRDLGEHVIVFRAVDDDYIPPEDLEEDEDPVEDEAAIYELTLNVIANSPPGQPVIVSPRRGEEITEIRPMFVIQNPEDPEGDSLFITFDVDESDGYAFPISSGQLLTGEDGETSWTVTEDLQQGVRYNWRACATDGNSEDVCVSSYFIIEPGEGGLGGDDDCECDCEAYVDSGCAVTGSRPIRETLGATTLIAFFLGLVCLRLRRS